ncbi:MAG: hypothetical protein QXG39_01875 [Candidatus Aenigmatarchaeota archaeon]
MAYPIEKPRAEIYIYYQKVAPAIVPTMFIPTLIGQLYKLFKPLTGGLWNKETGNSFSLIYSGYNSLVEDIDYDYVESNVIIRDLTNKVDYFKEYKYYVQEVGVSVNKNEDKIIMSIPTTGCPLYISQNDYISVHSPLYPKPFKIVNYTISLASGATNVQLEVTAPVNSNLANVGGHLSILYPEIDSETKSVIFYPRRRIAWNINGNWSVGADTEYNYPYSIAITSSDIVLDGFIGEQVTCVGNAGTYIGTVYYVSRSVSGGTLTCQIRIALPPDASGDTITSVSQTSANQNMQDFGKLEIKVNSRYLQKSFGELPIVVTDHIAFYNEYNNKPEADEDNPITYAIEWVRYASLAPIYVYPIVNQSASDYVNRINNDVALERNSYSIIPLTKDRTIVQAVVNAVNNLNVPQKALFKRTLFGEEIPDYFPVATLTDEEVQVTNSRIAVADIPIIVQVGDTIKILKYIDGSNNTIDISGNPIILTVVAVDNVNITVAEKVNDIKLVDFNVERSFKAVKAQIKENLVSYGESFGTVYASGLLGNCYTVDSAGNYKRIPIYYVCAAYAGMIAAYPAQVHFNLKSIPGVYRVDRTWDLFFDSELSELAGAGWSILIQDYKGTIPYIRNCLTTDVSSTLTRNLSIAKSVDFTARMIWDVATSLLKEGYNIAGDAEGAKVAVKISLDALFNYLTGTSIPRYGPVLLQGSVQSIEVDPSGEGLIITVSLEYPKPLLRLTFKLNIS